eukprot:evm.model.NODE_20706_length_1251_cov_21.507593.1
MRVLDRYLPLIDISSSSSRSGGEGASLRAVLVIEDLGAADPISQAATGATEALAATAAVTMVQQQAQQLHPPTLPPSFPLALTLLDVERKKLEFEDWRHRTEVEWSERLRAKEAERMSILDRMHERREKEQREFLVKGQAEFERLEKELRRRLGKVEERERMVDGREEELKARAKKQVEECQALQRRLREEGKHLKEVERLRNRELEGQLARMTQAREEAEAKVKEVEEEFARFRREARKATPTALHQEVVTLKGEKAELRARMEREKGEKTQALLEKEQYRAAAQRVARALKREQKRANVNIRRHLGEMRLEYVVAGEGGTCRLDGERGELQDIKMTLDA